MCFQNQKREWHIQVYMKRNVLVGDNGVRRSTIKEISRFFYAVNQREIPCLHSQIPADVELKNPPCKNNTVYEFSCYLGYCISNVNNKQTALNSYIVYIYTTFSHMLTYHIFLVHKHHHMADTQNTTINIIRNK